MAVMALTRGPGATIEAKLPFIIGTVSLGTLVAWYDFYLYGVLAGVFAAQFFPGDAAQGLIYSLGIFWTGFLVRPIGAAVFGHLGDLVGRKLTLVLTLAAMGAASFIIGCLPGTAELGWLAPLLLVLFRVVQGLAMGGEYGVAATYVAELSPDGKRGLYTSWLQTTATLGIVLALLVILACRYGFGDAPFGAWAWRVPFWLSALLVLLAAYLRLKLDETPLFTLLKEQGKAAPNPALESVSQKKNQRLLLMVLFGAAAPEGVIWYTSQFYALYYLSSVLGVPSGTVYGLMMIVLLLASPLFVVFGALSERFGRRNLMLAGFLLAAASYWPVFAVMSAVKTSPVLLGVLVFYLTALAAMVYGPLAALLVELFPGRVRCISVSLPYQIGNGVFGGLVPLAGPWLATVLGGPLYGLVYPIAIALVGAAVGVAWLPERSEGVSIWKEVGGGPPRVPDQP
jgi:MFS family permease